MLNLLFFRHKVCTSVLENNILQYYLRITRRAPPTMHMTIITYGTIPVLLYITTGNPGFAEGLKLSAKGIKHSAKPSPRVALGKGPTEFFSRPRFFVEHSSSRLSAQAVPRAHSGPSAKKSSR
jgi:hypothetical protein